jgi:hypothetical protein
MLGFNKRYCYTMKTLYASGLLIRLVTRKRLRWTADPLPAYDSRCALLGLEYITDRRTVASALLIHLTCKLRFEQRPYARRRYAQLILFFYRTNYGKLEPFDNAIINLTITVTRCESRHGSRSKSRHESRRKSTVNQE